MSPFERLDRIKKYVEEHPYEGLSLSDILSDNLVPDRCNPARGFRYGIELFNNLSGLPGKILRFPRIHMFSKNNVWVTAIEDSEEGANVLLDFALHAITSYQLGDAKVYMMDSNIGGIFRGLYSISSNLNDNSNSLNNFHYVTQEEQRETVIRQLEQTVGDNLLVYLKEYDNLVDYNIAADKMVQPYNFLFVRDICGVFKDSTIDLISKMINNGNATSAGVYIFYTYKKDDLITKQFEYSKSALRTLVERSFRLDSGKKIQDTSKIILDCAYSTKLIDKVIEYIEKYPAPDSTVTFKSEISDMLQSGTLWKSYFDGVAIDSITIPLGYKDAVNQLEISFKLEGSPHAYVAGNSGFGKTILLHNIILNSALRYSPEQLQFYLIDLKAGGQSFVFYKNLPHVRALSDSASRFYALSVLKSLEEEIKNKRGPLISKNHFTRIDEYNRKAIEKGESILPFIIVIMDEFQVLLNGDSEAREGAKLLNYFLQQGRSMGVFLVLCSQKIHYNGINELAQIRKRICMQLHSSDSEKLIGNSGASQLTQTGMAILNEAVDDSTGASNQQFKVAFIDENADLDNYVRQIREIYLRQRNGLDSIERIIFNGGRLSDNTALPRRSEDKYIYVGVPYFCRKEHARFSIQRTPKSNVVIVGNDKTSALRLIGMIVLQFKEIYAKSHIYLSDFQFDGDDTYSILDFLADNDSLVSLYKEKDFNRPQSGRTRSSTPKPDEPTGKEDVLDGLKKILDDRINNKEYLAEQPEILCVFINPQPNSLRNDILLKIMEQGGVLGMHVLIWLYNSNNSIAILNKTEGIQCSDVKISLYGGTPQKAFNSYSSNSEKIECNGMGILHIPSNMGLTNKEGDVPGDPFVIYNEIGDLTMSDSKWQILFSKLANVKDNNLDI